MISISLHEKRILLSRSLRLTRHKELTHAYWIKSSEPLEQLKDLVHALDLPNLATALTRCLHCNHLLVPVGKEKILHRLQARTVSDYDEFFLCPSCDKIYWKGSHVHRMVDFMRQALQVADSLPGGPGVL